MCRTMNELEKTVADYRSLKSMKEELDEQGNVRSSDILIPMINSQRQAETSP